MYTKETYQKQRNANIQAFTYDKEYYGKKYESLRKLSKAFKEAGIGWGVSCSACLFFNGINDDFHDYDIVIAKGDSEKAIEVLRKIGIEENANNKRCFHSDYYGEFSVEGVDIDVICEFGVHTFGAHYIYNFDPQYATIIKIDDFEVPIIPEEAQWCLYSMMIGWQPQRVFKRNLLTQYLKIMGVSHPQVFEEALKASIPYWLKDEIRKI